MSSAVIRQIENGWVVTFYIPQHPDASGGIVPPNEYEQYYTDIASASAGIATAL